MTLLLNIRGIKAASLLQSSMIIFLVVMACALVGLSLFEGDTSNAEPLFTDSAGLLAVLVVVPFFFVGFDVIPQSAEEVKVPPHKVGRLVIVSVAMAPSTSPSSSRPVWRCRRRRCRTSISSPRRRWRPCPVSSGGNLVVAGLLTSWNAFLIGASRLMWAMANSGMLPAWFAKLHPQHKTPVNALLFIGAICAVAPFFGEVMMGWLVDSSSVSIVITYLLVSAVFIVLRRREPEMHRPLRVGGRSAAGGIAVGVAAVITTARLLALYVPGMPAMLDVQPYVILGLWWLLGVVFLVRVPGGVAPGEDAEERLLERLAERRSSAS